MESEKDRKKSAGIGDRQHNIRELLKERVVRDLVDRFPEIERSLNMNDWSLENLGLLFSFINFFGIDSVPNKETIKPDRIPEYVRRIKEEVIRHKDW